MKMNKDKEEDHAKLCIIKVPMDHGDKQSKRYLVNIKKCDVGTSEEFLKW
jgi:hypothetical protein